MSTEKLNLDSIEELLKTTAKLRAPDGCPWDREQTHKSLKKYLIEESYEVLEAIDRGESSALLEELGDLLFQVCLHSQIEAEAGEFDFVKVAETINQKMISRHPHVFGEVNSIESSADVVDQWEKIKASEKGNIGKSPFANIPKELPSLMRAVKVLKKADKLKVNYDFDKENSIIELDNIKDEKQLGDLLLRIAHQAKNLKLDPEESLRQAVNKIQSDLEERIS